MWWGEANAPRLYAMSQGDNGGAGQVEAIETTAQYDFATLPVGRGPVYGVMTLDDRRAFHAEPDGRHGDGDQCAD